MDVYPRYLEAAKGAVASPLRVNADAEANLTLKLPIFPCRLSLAWATTHYFVAGGTIGGTLTRAHCLCVTPPWTHFSF